MTIFFTLVTDGPTVGDYDRIAHSNLGDALSALDNLPREQLVFSHVEVCRGENYWKLSNTNAVYRSFEDMPA